MANNSEFGGEPLQVILITVNHEHYCYHCYVLCCH